MDDTEDGWKRKWFIAEWVCQFAVVLESAVKKAERTRSIGSDQDVCDVEMAVKKIWLIRMISGHRREGDRRLE